jgi:hypothetical protein
LTCLLVSDDLEDGLVENAHQQSLAQAVLQHAQDFALQGRATFLGSWEHVDLHNQERVIAPMFNVG